MKIFRWIFALDECKQQKETEFYLIHWRILALYRISYIIIVFSLILKGIQEYNLK